jgi:hypothetical protein
VSVSDKEAAECSKERREAEFGDHGAKPETRGTANSKKRIAADRMLMVGNRVCVCCSLLNGNANEEDLISDVR